MKQIIFLFLFFFCTIQTSFGIPTKNAIVITLNSHDCINCYIPYRLAEKNFYGSNFPIYFITYGLDSTELQLFVKDYVSNVERVNITSDDSLYAAFSIQKQSTLTIYKDNKQIVQKLFKELSQEEAKEYIREAHYKELSLENFKGYGKQFAIGQDYLYTINESDLAIKKISLSSDKDSSFYLTTDIDSLFNAIYKDHPEVYDFDVSRFKADSLTKVREFFPRYYQVLGLHFIDGDLYIPINIMNIELKGDRSGISWVAVLLKYSIKENRTTFFPFTYQILNSKLYNYLRAIEFIDNKMYMNVVTEGTDSLLVRYAFKKNKFELDKFYNISYPSYFKSNNEMGVRFFYIINPLKYKDDIYFWYANDAKIFNEKDTIKILQDVVRKGSYFTIANILETEKYFYVLYTVDKMKTYLRVYDKNFHEVSDQQLFSRSLYNIDYFQKTLYFMYPDNNNKIVKVSLE